MQRALTHSAGVVNAPDTVVSPVASSLQTAPDLAALRRRQQAGWACGDLSVIDGALQIVGENLVEAVNLRAGETVLDVAAGCGNATLAAARRFAHITSTDQVATWLDKGRERARAESLPVSFQVADAESLPFADASFDVVLSSFGAMYAIEPARAAREMQRVLRPNGRIGLTCWTPEGLFGRLLRLIGQHVPSPAGLPSPALWGRSSHLAALFEVAPAQIRCRRRDFHFRYRSAAHWVQVFRDFHGPLHKTFAALDAAGQQALERDLTALLEAMNAAGETTLVARAEYLEAVITTSNPRPRK